MVAPYGKIAGRSCVRATRRLGLGYLFMNINQLGNTKYGIFFHPEMGAGFSGRAAYLTLWRFV
jgi:hypothetical protein